MIRTPALRRSRLTAGLAPLLIALGALPLMAPTCGSPGEGYKTFSRLSLIIPMDVCYQYQTDGVSGSYTPAPTCPQPVDPGNVIRGYGLVYELIRAGVPVYWIIQQGKPSVTAVDLTVQYAGGAPVLLYDWTSGGQGAAPSASHSIDYRGGPFVVDGSDYAKASAVLQQFKATFSGVNVHVANVAFRGYAKRTMAGGWSAGGTVPPKLALLDIGSSGAGSKNSEFVIQGYLAQAGLDTANAGGTTAGPHGQIYDHLYMPDFIPTIAGDWHATRLYRNGYQILWVPHWTAPSSCSDCPPGPSCSCAIKYDAATIATALKTIGSFVAEGGDLFAECAGLGSFEGVFSSNPPSTASYSSTYVLSTEMATGGEPTTHFQTSSPTGVWINQNVGSVTLDGSFDSPFMQIGDYPFIARTGAIQNYDSSTYKPEVTKLITDTASSFDIFTLVPRTSAHGTIVYLGGHSYSGNDGSFEVAGTRLVLNTLFNLGATCTATGLPCNTGLFGICSQGAWACDTNGQPYCQQTVFPRPETCNGLDDDCNGAVDEGLVISCYQAPAGYVDPLGRTLDAFMATSTVGECSPGTSSCARNLDGTYGMSACVGQKLPSPETCNARDDDCNGKVDDDPATASKLLEQACYDGPAYSIDGAGNTIGNCRKGTQVCQSGAWGGPLGSFVPGACPGEVLPQPEPCSATTAVDLNCDGQFTSCGCTNGANRPCFSGPGTPGVGACRSGSQVCQGSVWGALVDGVFVSGACGGEKVADPGPEPCTLPAKPSADPGYIASADTNCDGKTTQCAACNGTEQIAPGVPGRSCYGTWGTTDPAPIPSIAGRGQCSWGSQTCQAGVWGPCVGYGRASAIEYCDGEDNNCNGARVASPDGRVGVAGSLVAIPNGTYDTPGIDDNAVCPAGSTCLRGVCVPAACGTERPAPEAYTCTSPTGGTIVPAACGSSPSPGCGVGEVCHYGTCVDPCPVSPTKIDPETLLSVSLVCAKGTVCGGGACIAGGCYEAGCGTGQLCLGGTCVADPCTGVTCPSGTFCRQGDCVQGCVFITCEVGNKCGIDGFCGSDPCAGITCGAGQLCTAGHCAADPCNGLGCAKGQVCDPSTGVALCVDDPCTGVACPAGVCIRGQCFATGNPTGAGTAPASSSSSGGCHCGSGSGVALPALLALLAAPFARRRRRSAAGGGGALLLAVLASVSLAASGCKPKADAFDPSGCAETCGEQRCVDVTSDPAHCGKCSSACLSGYQCVESKCYPAGPVAPHISGLAPSTGAKDDPAVALTLSGERFQDGATVRMTTPLGPRTVTCTSGGTGTCRFVSSGTLQVTVDLTGVPIDPGTAPFTLQVVNGNVISNTVTLGVIVPVPSLAGVVPSSVLFGTTTTLAVSGTGFTSGSQCRLQGAAIGEIGLPSTLSGGELDCVLDASAVPAGSYSLTVMSEKNVRSNSLGLTVTPTDPVVFSISPSSGTGTIALNVTGDRFDASSKVLFDGTAITSTLYVDPAHLFVGSFALPAATGIYPVAVQNGAGATARISNAVNFSVGGSPPSITSFSPPTAYQADTVPLSFVGTQLTSGSLIEVQPPGSTVFTALAAPTRTPPACTTACTGLSQNLSLIQSPGVPSPEGTYYVRVRLADLVGSPTLAPWPLRVLSNQAVLRNYAATPAPAQSGQVGAVKTGVTFQVSNLHPASGAVQVYFTDPSFPSTILATLDPTITVTTGTAEFATIPPATMLNVPAGVYQFTVHNPNATLSNALTFNVTPGPPTLSTVCVTGTSCTQQTKQAPTPVTITLGGLNFAAPDASGNNGSTVFVASSFMPGWDPSGNPTFACSGAGGVQPLQVPSPQVPGTVTVKSATRIDVTIDTQGAYVDPTYGTTYYVSVWNPSGTGPPLKSGATGTACTTTNIDPRTMPWFKIVPGP